MAECSRRSCPHNDSPCQRLDKSCQVPAPDPCASSYSAFIDVPCFLNRVCGPRLRQGCSAFGSRCDCDTTGRSRRARSVYGYSGFDWAGNANPANTELGYQGCSPNADWSIPTSRLPDRDLPECEPRNTTACPLPAA